MGSIQFDFLADNILFDKRAIDNKYKDVSISRLENELTDYRSFCIDNFDKIVNDLRGKSELKVFTSTSETPISLLKQTALYINQYIINDPIFPYTSPKSEAGKVTAKYLGYKEGALDKSKLADDVRYINDIVTMVANDYVKLFPLSYYSEAPNELKINMPVDNYNNVLPKELMEFFHKNAIVTSLYKMEDGEGWYSTDKLEPCRGIIVDFKGNNYSIGMLYHLFQTKIIDYNEETGIATISQTLPETPPSNEEFEAWVNQSINSAAKAYYDKVFFENVLASNLDATYLCDNSFKNELITTNFETKETIGNFTANQILKFDLPFLDRIDTDKLMEVRNAEEEVFTNFRLELEKHFRELRTINDPDELRIGIENIFHELNDVQVERINQKVSQLRKKMGTNILVGLGGLVGSIHTGGSSLIATATAIVKGYKDYNDYKREVNENPSSFLWRVRR